MNDELHCGGHRDVQSHALDTQQRSTWRRWRRRQPRWRGRPGVASPRGCNQYASNRCGQMCNLAATESARELDLVRPITAGNDDGHAGRRRPPRRYLVRADGSRFAVHTQQRLADLYLVNSSRLTYMMQGIDWVDPHCRRGLNRCGTVGRRLSVRATTVCCEGQVIVVRPTCRHHPKGRTFRA